MNIRFVLNFLHVFSISGYLGSIFSMVVLGRSHDFSHDWGEVATSRLDIWHIILYINLPSLVVFFITEILLFRGNPTRLTHFKWILDGITILLTLGVITSVADYLTKLAQKAVTEIPESTIPFHNAHLIEDIVGPINLVIFLLSVAIGIIINQRHPKKQNNV